MVGEVRYLVKSVHDNALPEDTENAPSQILIKQYMDLINTITKIIIS